MLTSHKIMVRQIKNWGITKKTKDIESKAVHNWKAVIHLLCQAYGTDLTNDEEIRAELRTRAVQLRK